MTNNIENYMREAQEKHLSAIRRLDNNNQVMQKNIDRFKISENVEVIEIDPTKKLKL